MNTKLHGTLMVTALAAALHSPLWAVEDTPGYQDTRPRSEAGQPMEGVSPMDNEPGYASPGATTDKNPLYSRTPAELQQDEVLDVSGTKVGTVKSVVAGQDRASAHVVVSSGGFLGIGDNEIIVPLEEMRILDDKLQVNETKESLQAREEYKPGVYIELQPDRPISEFSAFEPRME